MFDVCFFPSIVSWFIGFRVLGFVFRVPKLKDAGVQDDLCNDAQVPCISLSELFSRARRGAWLQQMYNATGLVLGLLQASVCMRVYVSSQ